MWLINTKTFALEEFASHPIEKYAILSHRWEENEVSFRSWMAREDELSQGYRKIMRFIQEAADRKFKYAWADTCCVNKESSAELSEAINSMFKYYQESAECYVYLSDLPPSSRSDNNEPSTSSSNSKLLGGESRNSAFRNSKWFTRGWTLQELIAPRTVKFFDSDWCFFGTKEGLKSKIGEITGIPTSILDGSAEVEDCSIACRMSWAANRQTTRVEDIAYCLLGIFDIHMPLLYGERQVAFTRLQEEICKKTTDMSLFAWKTLEPYDLYSGLLAISPSNFRDSAKVTSWPSGLQTDFNDEIAVTNRGIRFDNVSLYLNDQYGVLLELNCYEKSKEGTKTSLFVCLRRGPESWVRYRAFETICFDDPGRIGLKSLQQPRIFICRTMEPRSLRSSDLFTHAILFDLSTGIKLITAEPSSLWDLPMQGFLPNPGLYGAVHIYTKVTGSEPEDFYIICGISNNNSTNKNGFDWRTGYRFKVLSQRNKYFKETGDLIREKQLHTKEGYEKVRKFLRSYSSTGCWSATEGCYLEDSVRGIRHSVSVRALITSEHGANGDAWDVIKLHVYSGRIK